MTFPLIFTVVMICLAVSVAIAPVLATLGEDIPVWWPTPFRRIRRLAILLILSIGGPPVLPRELRAWQ